MVRQTIYPSDLGLLFLILRHFSTIFNTSSYEKSHICNSTADFAVLFPQLFQALETLPATVQFLDDAFNPKAQVAPFNDAGQAVSTNVEASTKSACFKQLGVDPFPRLPVKLDPVPVLVDDVYITVTGDTIKDVGHYAAKRMITLSHVGRLIVQPYCMLSFRLNKTAGSHDYTLDKVMAHLSMNAHHRAVGGCAVRC